MPSCKSAKVRILYKPDIDKEEKSIFENIFGENNISLNKYFTKGISAASFDVQFIIDFLEMPGVQATLIASFTVLVQELFARNRERRFGKEKRPRYTQVLLKKKKFTTIISNVNKENKLTIKCVEHNTGKTILEDYSKEKLDNLLKKN